MEQTSRRPKIAAQFNEEFYWERVNRSLGWLGNSDEEQRCIQEAIKDVTIGLAGCGGIGGMAASRLGRLGVGKIKLADPDTFDVSNINRQVGASPTNKGRNPPRRIRGVTRQRSLRKWCTRSRRMLI